MDETVVRHPITTSVVIPNWNGVHLLPIILESLRSQTSQDFETIVVDSGSDDGSLDYLSSEWPEVRVIPLGHNGGFSAAVNPGMQQANGRYVALVNNDLELDVEWIATMADLMDGRPDVASAVGKILDYTDRDLIQEMGVTFAWDGLPRQIGRGERDTGQYDLQTEVFSVCAGAAIYRSSVIAEIGLFDERYFAYLEDVDWGFRAQLAGYKALYTPAVSAFHIGSATTKQSSLPVSKMYARNNLYLIAKNFPARALVAHAPSYVVPQLRRIAQSVKHGWWRDMFAAYREFVLMLPDVVRARRRSATAGITGRIRLADLPARAPKQ